LVGHVVDFIVVGKGGNIWMYNTIIVFSIIEDSPPLNLFYNSQANPQRQLL